MFDLLWKKQTMMIIKILLNMPKKGIASDVEITKLKEENNKLKHDFDELMTLLISCFV